MTTITLDRAVIEQALKALSVYASKAEHKRTHEDNCQAEEAITALYASLDQPAKVPLTDEELRMISKQQDPVVVLHHNVLAFAHAIIAAYEAKNGIGGGK